MNENRIDPFASLKDFQPKPEGKSKEIPIDSSEISADIDRISEKNGFPSREAKPVNPVKKQRFNARSPRQQLNIKVSQNDFERFYRMAEEMEARSLGDLFGLALDALEHQSKPK